MLVLNMTPVDFANRQPSPLEASRLCCLDVLPSGLGTGAAQALTKVAMASEEKADCTSLTSPEPNNNNNNNNNNTNSNNNNKKKKLDKIRNIDDLPCKQTEGSYDALDVT